MSGRHSAAATVHFINVGRFVCTALSGDPCRNYPACDCEMWDPELHGNPPASGHQPVSQAECWLAPWLDFDLADTYEQDDHGDAHGMEFPDGPVDYEVHGDFITWHYTDETRPVWGEDE